MGSLVSLPAAEAISDQQVTEKTEKMERGTYKDGVYTGEGAGFRGTTKVQVTVEDGYIADITVISFRDERDFFQKAESFVINVILTEQTYDVDAVSGATFSSNSIMEAVADALENSMGGVEPEEDGESESVEEQPGADGADELETDRRKEGGESESGADRPGAGEGNGHGSGQNGNGRHGRGCAAAPAGAGTECRKGEYGNEEIILLCGKIHSEK